MSCEEVLESLRARVSACEVETGRLRAEAERIAVLLAAREAELLRLGTALEVVAELPVLPEGRAAAPLRRVVVPAARRAPECGAVDPVGAVVAVLAEARGPMRAGQVAERLGLEATAGNVEKMRHRLKKAVAGGQAVKVPGGLFTLRGDSRTRESGRI